MDYGELARYSSFTGLPCDYSVHQQAKKAPALAGLHTLCARRPTVICEEPGQTWFDPRILWPYDDV